MQPTDADPFRNIMRGMCKLYAQEPDAVLLDAYWLALGSWTLAEFSQAAAHLMANTKFMPRPADFNDLRKASRPVAAEAWVKAIQSCSTAWRPSGYHAGTSGDPLIDNAVRAIGGYAAIAQCEQDKLHFLERRFTEIYESMQDANDVRQALPQLTNSTFGLAELNKRMEQRKLEHEPEPV